MRIADMTESAKNRLQTDLNKYAKEVVQMDLIRGCVYAYGSEIACYRIAMAYKNRITEVIVSYSENLKTWYFCLENVFE